MFRKSWFAVALVASAAIACNDSNGPDDISMVRVINASPDGPTVDFVLDGSLVQSGITYASPSAYQNVDEDADNLTLKSSSNGSSVTTHEVELETGRHYTEVLTGRATNLVSTFYEDNQDDPSAGNVKIRFIQAAPSMPLADVYITASATNIANVSPNLSNVAFRNTPVYIQVAGSTYRLRLTAAGTKTVLFDTDNVLLPSGGIRTILSLDKAGGGTPFTSLLLADKN